VLSWLSEIGIMPIHKPPKTNQKKKIENQDFTPSLRVDFVDLGVASAKNFHALELCFLSALAIRAISCLVNSVLV